MVFLRSHREAARVQASWLLCPPSLWPPAAHGGGSVAPEGLLGAPFPPGRRPRGWARPCLTVAFWVQGRALARWPWAWGLLSFHSQERPRLFPPWTGLGRWSAGRHTWSVALLPGPRPGTCACCDPGPCPGAQVEGFWRVPGQVDCQAQGTVAGGAEAAASPACHRCRGVADESVRTWSLRPPRVAGGSPEGPGCCE